MSHPVRMSVFEDTEVLSRCKQCVVVRERCQIVEPVAARGM